MTFAARALIASVGSGGGGGGSGPFLTRFDSNNYAFSSGNSNVSLVANTDGTLTVTGNSTGTISPNPGYYSPTTAAIGSNYQIRVTPTAGSFSTGTVNSWLTVSSARTWTVTTTSFKDVTFTIEIRDSSGTVLATTTGNLINCVYIAF